MRLGRTRGAHPLEQAARKIIPAQIARAPVATQPFANDRLPGVERVAGNLGVDISRPERRRVR
jgi:hypothetical protein